MNFSRTWASIACTLALTPLASGCRTGGSTASDIKFYGTDNQSSHISFESYIEIPIPDGINSQTAILEEPTHSEMLDLINWQIEHIYGAITEHPGYKRNPGIILGKGTPKIKGAKLDRTRGTVQVRYSYEDKAVFKKKLFANGKAMVKFFLPLDPSTIYAKGMSNDQSTNLCTDEHYNSEDDFWYFWNPKKTGCPIKNADLISVEAVLNPIPSTAQTYPYYDKILGDNGNGRLVKVVYLVGVDENFRTGDVGRLNYNEAFELLKAEGFKTGPGSGARQKNMTLSHADYDVELTLRLVNASSQEFIEAAADGLETADVFIYDGHSGLGSYLSIDRFEQDLGRELELNKSKSQIFYFNGCSTFAYYNADFFKLKATSSDPEGIKNLDIITTSIGAYFSIGAYHDIPLIQALFNGKRPSWQKIMDEVYEIDKSQTALTHVNGDEDNPTSP